MKMLPALAHDSSITENGHFLVRPNGDRYEVVDTITDEVDTYTDPETEEEHPLLFTTKVNAEFRARLLAQGAQDAAPVE